MYVSATDPEKSGQVTASVYTSSTEEVLHGFPVVYVCRDQLLCQCILFILHVFGTILIILKGHCNQKIYFLSFYSHENFKLTLFYMDTCFIIH